MKVYYMYSRVTKFTAGGQILGKVYGSIAVTGFIAGGEIS